MQAILEYVSFTLEKIVATLNVQIFSDFNITYFQFLLVIFLLPFVFKLLFGGLKEFDSSMNWMNSAVTTKMSNYARKEYLSKKQDKDFIKSNIISETKLNDKELADIFANAYFDKHSKMIYGDKKYNKIYEKLRKKGEI